MDINFVVFILFTMVVVGFALHRAITLKSIDAKNKRFYDLNKKLKRDLERCTSLEQSQAVITAFLFKSSAMVDEVSKGRCIGVPRVKTGEIKT
ncbi:hypothetical protein [Pseudoalteromonas obscura]|uniref:Uncharacterized protein n=1 Tax=Pseudoalteromonas obscura TaxID=3048491 RepID=A0ABT7EK86_9GAMM|nr:hypothetical protein [Pseudoalteromonas sp. P94(2023)]MDK2595427.1 hypothetical protein [Pseudoalteromonas sp. P94(2023)]